MTNSSPTAAKPGRAISVGDAAATFDPSSGSSSSAVNIDDGGARAPTTITKRATSNRPAAPSEDEPDEDNGEVLPAQVPRVHFAWTSVDADPRVATIVEGHTLSGTVENLTDDVLYVELRVQADAGTNHILAFPPVTLELANGGSIDIQVPLDDFGFDFAAQRYSGRVAVFFFAFDAEGSTHYQVEDAPALYFHPDGDALVVYSEDLMRSTYNAGDFVGADAVEPEPGTVIHRIVEGTKVTYLPDGQTDESVVEEGDDATPASGVEEVQ